jgi:hypothetical protein
MQGKGVSPGLLRLFDKDDIRGIGLALRVSLDGEQVPRFTVAVDHQRRDMVGIEIPCGLLGRRGERLGVARLAAGGST